MKTKKSKKKRKSGKKPRRKKKAAKKSRPLFTTLSVTDYPVIEVYAFTGVTSCTIGQGCTVYTSGC